MPNRSVLRLKYFFVAGAVIDGIAAVILLDRGLPVQVVPMIVLQLLGAVLWIILYGAVRHRGRAQAVPTA